MRLKGHFKDATTFLRVMQTMARMSSRCILRFSPNTIQIAIPRSADAVEAYASLDDVNAIFHSTYRVESNFNNQVNLEVSPDALVSALKSADAGSSDVVLKLAKNNTHAILLLVITRKMESGDDLAVSHEVFIDIKKPSDMKLIRTAEEALEKFNYHISTQLPDLAEMRAVAERMKALDTKNDRITIGVNRAGEMKLALHADEISIESKWTGLTAAEASADQAARSTEAEAARKNFKAARVDLKAFVRLLSSPMVNYTAEVFIQNRAVATFILHLRSPEASAEHEWAAHILINLPALSSGDDY